MSWFSVAKWVALGVAILFVIQMIRNDGAQSVKNKIERQNNEAAQKSDTARLGYDDCLDAGRVWNFSAGECQRAP